MYKLLKPFGRISWETECVGDIVELVGLESGDHEERKAELDRKLAECDILQADVDIKVDEELFSKAPNLKAVFCTSIGTDYVDLKAATEHGVIVANNPDFCILAVAEYAVGMMYALMRNIPRGVEGVKEGNWAIRGSLGGAELFGKTLGVIGFGKTGREVARQAIGIGMDVNCYDPFMNEELAAKLGAKPMTMEEVLESADVVTIHVPLMDETRNLISAEQFGMMKDGVYLVNCARGGIVNEEALLEALKSGKVKGAALDVLSEEPPKPDHILLNYEGDNLIITPHIAWYTAEAAVKNHIFYSEQVRDFVEGRTPKAVANRDVLR